MTAAEKKCNSRDTCIDYRFLNERVYIFLGDHLTFYRFNGPIYDTFH